MGPLAFCIYGADEALPLHDTIRYDRMTKYMTNTNALSLASNWLGHCWYVNELWQCVM